jgi:hypothetical protein
MLPSAAVTRRRLHLLLRLSPEQVVNEDRHSQRKTARQSGCQIDYLAGPHINGVSEETIHSGHFAHIIDMGELPT